MKFSLVPFFIISCALFSPSLVAAGTNCLRQDLGLKNAYYTQVDLIRRGLPSIVVQAEYTYAINYVAKRDPWFQSYYNLDSFCVWSMRWNQVFDGNFRCVWAFKYIMYLRNWKPKIHFLTDSRYPSLPPMSSSEQELVDSLWQETFNVMKYPPRYKYSYKEFRFPKNIEILYDPERQVACSEYQKFGPTDSPDALGSRLVLVSILISSLEVFAAGGNTHALAALLRHAVSYIFNGVRCKRKEGNDVKIPRQLQDIYTRYLAYLYASVVNPHPVALITSEAVEVVFDSEIDSLTSYNSWGNVEYAKLTSTTQVPKVYNSVDSMFTSSTYQEVTTTSSRQLVRDGLVSPSEVLNIAGHSYVYNTSIHHLKGGTRLNGTTVRSTQCSVEFFYILRQNRVSDALENCCAKPCEIWGLVAGYHLGSPFEECCSRCNQLKCPGITTEDDVFDTDRSLLLVPEFGEQQAYHVRLVTI